MMTSTDPVTMLNPGRAWSMRLRALLTGAVVVGTFMVLAGVALERAYRETALEASRERLQANIYMLMSSANVAQPGEVLMPAVLPSPELSVPGSGVLASITDATGTLLWRSESSLVAPLVYPRADEPGQPVFGLASTGDGQATYTLSYPLIWELDGGAEYALVFHAAEDAGRVAAAVAEFRDTLVWWLGGATLFLLLLQSALLVWVMRPLQQVAAEVRAVEAGEREQLTGAYPRELLPLTQNLNAMVRSGQARINRYRNALGDLAHSLKTPLAVLRNRSAVVLEGEARAEFEEQLERMDATIGYQLQRAALSGRSPLTAPVDVAATLQSLVKAFEKVYHHKRLRIDLDIQRDTHFVGDTGDLAELLGNLGDNACKYCTGLVKITAANERCRDGRERLLLRVEDDGPGIPESLRGIVTERGMRADSRQPGQGIGLAIVRDIVVEAYGGELRVDTSQLGGARVEVRI